MKGRLLVAGGRVLSPRGELDRPPVRDILIEDGRIAALGEPGSLASDAPVLDAAGTLVVPGFVNAHYHSHDLLLRGLFEQLPLEAWGLYSFPSSFPRRPDAEVRTRTLLGAAENLLCGTTTIQDMATIVGPDRAHVAALREAYRESGIRAVVALQYADRAAVDTVPFWREDLPAEIQAELGPAIDPAPVQALLSDLLAEPPAERFRWALGPSAPQRCSDELLRWTARLAAERDVPVFTHVYETRSQAVLARRAYAADGGSLLGPLDRAGLLDARLTIAHGVWITEAEVARLGAAGANLSCNPFSNLKLLNGVAPVRLYDRAGAGIALGCDNCSGNDAQNLFESMKAFALFWGLSGQAGESGAAARAFTAATLGGARALGLAGEVGDLAPGFRADLALLRLDDPAFVPLNGAVRQLVYAASPRAVGTVLVGGDVVVRDGRVLTFDRARLAAEAESCAADLCACRDGIARRFGPARDAILAAHRRIACEPLDIDRMRLG